MPSLHLQLLGGFHLTDDGGAAVEVLSMRQQLLLAFLVLHADRPLSRAHVAFVLWPETNEAQAMANLRRELSTLRRRLPLTNKLLDIRPESVQWRPNAPATADVLLFQAHISAADAAIARSNTGDLVASIQAAVDLYCGPLLPACYEDWVLAAREELDATYVRALQQLAAQYEAQRDYAKAIACAQRLLRHDPLYEPVYLQLMRLYAVQGEHASALRLYHTCVDVLERELGVQPDTAIQALYRRLVRRDEEKPDLQAPTIQVHEQALVGRKTEWQRLLSAWQHVTAGHAHLLLIRGEAGIGKTRLAEELLEWVERQGRLTARAHCYAAEGELAYAPIVAWLRSEGLWPQLAHLNSVWLTEIARLVPDLLVEHPELPRPEPLTERWQRTRLFEALARAVLVERQPALFLLDDLQWCDDETLAWLRYLLHFDNRAPLLIIGTLREEDLLPDHALHEVVPVLRAQNQVTEIILSSLDAPDTIALARQVSQSDMAEQVEEQLVAETEGNPLFIVEMVRSGLPIVAPSVTSTPLRTLPAKVQAVIHARLSQLSSPAQVLVDLAAAIGRSFTFAVLTAAGSMQEDEVVAALDELWQRRIISVQDLNAYDFSHDRIREVAYARISPVRRPQLHRRIAEALRQVYVEDLDGVSSQIAFHYEQAGWIDEAIDWHERAAAVHARLHAARDAAAHLSAALDLMAKLAPSPARTRRQIDLLQQLSDSHAVAHGVAATERQIPLLKARELLRQTHDDRRHFRILTRLLNYHTTHGEVEVGLALARDLVAIAERLQTPVYVANALRAQAACLYAYGRWADAFDVLRRSLAAMAEVLAEPTTRESNDELDPATWYAGGLRDAALVAWALGHADQAQAYMAESSAKTGPMLSPYNYTNRVFTESLLYRLMVDVDAVAAAGEEMLTLGKQYELPMSISSGQICLGWAIGRRGDVVEGARLVEEGVAGFRQMGHTLHQPLRLADLAGLYICAGRFDAARAALDEAQTICKAAGERRWETEVHRMGGQLAAAQGQPAEQVEQQFNRALDVARRQHAKALELRTAISLAEYWQQQDRVAAALALLKPIYDWFTEGYDTYDLRRAADLLRRLA